MIHERFYILDTSPTYTEIDKDFAWTILVHAAGQNARTFIVETDERLLLAELNPFGRATARGIIGSVTPAFIRKLAVCESRRTIDNMEFFDGNSLVLEHYERGRQFSVRLADDQFVEDVVKRLEAEGLDPRIADWKVYL